MENRVGIRKNSTIKMMASRTEFTLSLIIIALFFFAFFFTKAFGSPYNLTNLAKQGAIIGVLAVAQTSVIITGGIDISGGSIAGLGCMVMALLQTKTDVSFPTTVLACLAVCVVCGVINGIIIYERDTQHIAERVIILDNARI